MATKSGKIDAVKVLMNDLVPMEALNFPIADQNLPLSAYKCNPSFINDDGKSALEIAAETGNLDIFDYLLDSKIPYHNFDKYGNSCLHLASQKGYIEVKINICFLFTISIYLLLSRLLIIIIYFFKIKIVDLSKDSRR